MSGSNNNNIKNTNYGKINVATRLRRISPTSSSTCSNNTASQSNAMILHRNVSRSGSNSGNGGGSGVIVRTSSSMSHNLLRTNNSNTGHSTFAPISIPITKYIMVAIITILVGMMVAILTMVSILDQHYHMITSISRTTTIFQLPMMTGIVHLRNERKRMRIMKNNETTTTNPTSSTTKGNNDEKQQQQESSRQWVLCHTLSHPPNGSIGDAIT